MLQNKEPAPQLLPLRSVMVSKEELFGRARDFAEQSSEQVSYSPNSEIIERFRDNRKRLTQIFSALGDLSKNNLQLPTGGEWILDNFHVIEAEGREIHRHLPKEFLRTLPRFSEGSRAGQLRAEGLAELFICSRDSIIERESLSSFISGFQQLRQLTMGELWAIPSLLRVDLIENLRRLMDRSMQAASDRRIAEQIADAVLSPVNVPATDRIIDLAKRMDAWPNSTGPGAIYLLWRIRNHGRSTAVVLQWLEERLRENGIDTEQVLREEQSVRAADQITIGNCINSLREIAQIDWKEWFEELSVVEQILCEDPVGFFHQCDFITRDRYRHAIEELAFRSKQREDVVARQAIELARDKFTTLSSDKSIDPNLRLRLSHIGHYLVGRGRPELVSRLGIRRTFRELGSAIPTGWRSAVFLFGLAFLTAAFAKLPADLLHSADLDSGIIVAATVLFILAASQLALETMQWILLRFAPPRHLCKLDLSKGIPEHLRGTVICHTIVKDRRAIEHSIEALEVRYLGNDDPNLYFGLLADLADAPQAEMPGDANLIDYARELIDTLNRRHPDAPFFLLFRERRFNQSEGVFMGWERKRGKIEEFNRLATGDDSTSFRLIVGDLARIRSAKLVITLDGDTTLPSGSAKQLLGTLAHPLNRPILDSAKQRVKFGYSIIQPRIATSLTSANRTPFAKLFSGNAGLDPYTHLISNFYQDLFGEGSYVGKGAYDIHSFMAVLDKRVVDNSLLSHDLFESFFARVGVATDIELLDDIPGRYHAFARREHRWIRGDWQLAPWLLPMVRDGSGKMTKNPLTLLSRWKLFDNLRRSMVSLATLLLIVGAFYLGGAAGTSLLLLTLGVYMLPIMLGFADSVLSPPRNVSIGYYSKTLLKDLALNTAQALFTLVTLPHRFIYTGHAILVTLYRVFISKRHLLSWESAYHADRRLANNLASYVQAMAGGIALTVALLSVPFLPGANILGITWIFFGLWLTAPFTAFRLSRPPPSTRSTIKRGDADYLLGIARDTWWYFSDNLNAEHNYLIPDNLQIDPTRKIANRTSPTNIGLSMLACVSAHDLGFTTIDATLTRLQGIFSTLSKLERWNGHFINWYDTISLSALRPRYVSTVDSGNMLGHLIALKQAIEELPNAPLFSKRQRVILSELTQLAFSDSNQAKQGADFAQRIEKAFPLSRRGEPEVTGATFALIEELLERSRTALQHSPNTLRLKNFLEELAGSLNVLTWLIPLSEVDKILTSSQVDPEINNSILRDIGGALRIFQRRTPSLVLVGKSLKRLASILERISTERHAFEKGCEQFAVLEQWLKLLDEELGKATALYSKQLTIMSALREDCDKLINEIDLSALYDQRKRTFYIGYQLDGGRNDTAHYDLLASEAQLSSFVAIALGQVEQKHWFQLGRSITETSGGRALLSWSGTMFEYLMPSLVLKDIRGTLISETHKCVVNTQMQYGHEHGVPWGISESAYAGVDFEKTYQYRAFGVPTLGFKRGLSSDLVVSPYSTALSLPVDPHNSIANLRALEKVGARGEYGFYEAIDYTPQRLTENEKLHMVRSFFAHHQGMSLVAINNLLNEGIMQRRFHNDPRVKAAEPLLTEKFPFELSPVIPRRKERSVLDEREGGQAARSITESEIDSPTPRSWILSNGNYTVMLDNSGSGFSATRGEMRLTRWREDQCANDLGQFIYLRDLDSNKVWSATYQPTKQIPQSYEVIFDAARIVYRRRDSGLISELEVTVSPEERYEVRKLTLTNLTPRGRTIEVTSYGEVVLAQAPADDAHPAFNKMFIQSEYIPELETLIYSRRPRSDHEKPIFLSHTISMPVCFSETQYESSRFGFIGRGNTLESPAALQPGAQLNAGIGPVLDPIFSLRTSLEIGPGQSHQVIFTTACGDSKEELLSNVARYREAGAAERTFALAESHTSIELRHQQFNISQAISFQRLANALLFNTPKLRGPGSAVLRNKLGQSGLWRFGISGDYPLVVLRVSEQTHCAVLNEFLLAHEYLRRRGFNFELLVVNERMGGYLQEFEQELDFYLKAGACGGWVDKRGGVFLRSLSQLNEQEQDLIAAVARVFVHADQGSLPEQMAKAFPASTNGIPKRTFPEPLSNGPSTAVSPPVGDMYNGFGTFVDNGRSYQMAVSQDERPPLPWSNIIANKRFGMLITESGSGYTWAENSRENRLTPWSNDPVIDPPSEVVYLRFANSGQYTSLTPSPCGGNRKFIVTHGFGWSQFSGLSSGVEHTMIIHGSPDKSAKWYRIKLKNTTSERLQLDLIFYIDFVLGVQRATSARTLAPTYDPPTQALSVVNMYNNEFAGRVVSIGSNLELGSFSASRFEFIGRNGTLAAPHAFANPSGPLKLAGTISPGNDVAGVLHVNIPLGPGEEREACFFMADSDDLEAARKDVAFAKSIANARMEEERSRKFWSEITGTITCQTPEKSFDIFMNGWLLYQTLSCRILARSAFYQSGGAIGFRDQLQDCLALLPIRPDLVRSQILLHSEHQFPEGDVQHWWHPPTGRGVRTRISDDFLWLPYAVSRYIEATGDNSILSESTTFVESPPLAPEHMESYLVPNRSTQKATILDHCIRAIEYGMTEGSHGLPLMGAGDWNDGMNEVGRHGKGESVWLGWFQIEVLRRFIPLLKRSNDSERIARYEARIQKLQAALEQNCWDGEWYRRAFYDDGTPLGSKVSMECQIDSLAQSWAVITAAGDPVRAKQALASAHQHLVRREDGTVLLLTPAFDKCPENPGYIKGYLPGIRENGGQYTHAAAWLVLATAKSGDGDLAFELFQILNPLNRARDLRTALRYRAEPYVLCGDVYSNPALRGHGGWSWYTGSSGWMFQVGLHEMLGVRFYPGAIEIDPCIPKSWPTYSVTIQRPEGAVKIVVSNLHGASGGVKELKVNGSVVQGNRIELESLLGPVEIEVSV